MGVKAVISFVGSAVGSGGAYMAAQLGTISYLGVRELVNIATGQPLSSVPDILKEYALYTSAAACIGEIGGYKLANKIWQALKRGD